MCSCNCSWHLCICICACVAFGICSFGICAKRIGLTDFRVYGSSFNPCMHSGLHNPCLFLGHFSQILFESMRPNAHRRHLNALHSALLSLSKNMGANIRTLRGQPDTLFGEPIPDPGTGGPDGYGHEIMEYVSHLFGGGRKMANGNLCSWHLVFGAFGICAFGVCAFGIRAFGICAFGICAFGIWCLCIWHLVYVHLAFGVCAFVRLAFAHVALMQLAFVLLAFGVCAFGIWHEQCNTRFPSCVRSAYSRSTHALTALSLSLSPSLYLSVSLSPSLSHTCCAIPDTSRVIRTTKRSGVNLHWSATRQPFGRVSALVPSKFRPPSSFKLGCTTCSAKRLPTGRTCGTASCWCFTRRTNFGTIS